MSYPDQEDASVQFTNVQKMLMTPFVGYSDFECTLIPENHAVSTGIVQPEKKRAEVKYQGHTSAPYITKFVSIVLDFTLPEQEGFDFPQREPYVGEDAAGHYLDYVQQVANALYEIYIKK